MANFRNFRNYVLTFPYPQAACTAVFAVCCWKAYDVPKKRSCRATVRVRGCCSHPPACCSKGRRRQRRRQRGRCVQRTGCNERSPALARLLRSPPPADARWLQARQRSRQCPANLLLLHPLPRKAFPSGASPSRPRPPPRRRPPAGRRPTILRATRRAVGTRALLHPRRNKRQSRVHPQPHPRPPSPRRSRPPPRRCPARPRPARWGACRACRRRWRSE